MAVCRDCGQETDDLYYISPVGRMVMEPRCRECHEQAVRLEAHRRAMDREKEVRSYEAE